MALKRKAATAEEAAATVTPIRSSSQVSQFTPVKDCPVVRVRPLGSDT